MNDKALRDRVIAALDCEPSIDASDIGVTTERGVVVLSGHVPNYWQLHMAEQTAKRVSGVRGLVQKMEIRPAVSDDPDDEELAVRAVNSLNWNVALPKDRIQVEVRDGLVTLTGDVDWQYQRQAAQCSVAALIGIRGVSNLIRVTTCANAADAPAFGGRMATSNYLGAGE